MRKGKAKGRPSNQGLNRKFDHEIAPNTNLKETIAFITKRKVTRDVAGQNTLKT